MFVHKFFKESMKSGNCLIELLIEPSFREDVCFRVYQMEKDIWKILWVKDFDINDIIEKTKEFVSLYPQFQKRTLSELREIEEYRKFIIRRLPIREKLLSSEEREMVIKLLNEGIPEVANKPGGLDGHGYRITIYGNEIIERDCWCILPKEWEHLVPFINFVTSTADLNQNKYGVYRVSTK